MTPPSCTACNSRTIAGFILGEVPICTRCRDSFLTWIARTGIIMADTHPMIRELCENSHYITSACWEYYNSDSGEKREILRLRK